MKKIIVTLRAAPHVSVEVPAEFPRKPRERAKGQARKIERSTFGAIRLFPGIPKAISADELEFLKLSQPGIERRLEVRNYVESRRIDYRGATEAELATLAEAEGLAHLPMEVSRRRLVERGKVKIPDPKSSSVTRLEGKGSKADPPKTTSRKPK